MMDQQKKIRTVMLFIADLTAGGAERVVSILANTWAAYADTEVSIVTLFDTKPFYPLDARVRLFTLGMTPGQTAVQRTRDLTAAAVRLRGLVGHQRPSFVLSFMNKYNVFCLAATRGFGVPIIVSERDSPTEGGLKLNWALRKLTYPKAAGVITQSQLSKDVLNARVSCKDIHVIANPVRTLIDQPWSGGEPIILNVGRLVEKKGQRDLLRAFARLKADGWRLVFCGEGPLRSALEREAHSLGLSDRVTFTGLVDDVGAWHRRAGVFALPSYWEGYPNALAEAMVSGLPCVSYDCPTGPADIITHNRNGLLVPVGDVDGLTQALQQLIDAPESARAMGREAAKLRDIVSPDIVCQAYLDYCATRAGSKWKMR
jgi:GalNAc-alpha-(1->4)-GalNAc-alpha-(1->3)-diNAcBac-PP-undecaprenol alpha-1,4-N-acetyl-D-galactosaminyltransferase